MGLVLRSKFNSRLISLERQRAKDQYKYTLKTLTTWRARCTKFLSLLPLSTASVYIELNIELTICKDLPIHHIAFIYKSIKTHISFIFNIVNTTLAAWWRANNIKVTRFLKWILGTFPAQRSKIIECYHYEIKNGDNYSFMYFEKHVIV